MRRWLYILFLGAISMAAQAQLPAIGSKSTTIPGNYVYFTVDNLDNIYVVTTSNQLKKLNSRGDSLAVYNDVKRFGEITSIDVSNPLKIVVFYKGFNTVVMLDQMLNVRNSINLRHAGIIRASAACLSYDSKLWVFDEVESVLKKVNDDGKLLQQTADFRQLFNALPTIHTLIDKDRFIYAYDSMQGLFSFDYYGTFKSKAPITHWQYLNVIDGNVYGVQNGFINIYNTRNFRYSQIALPAYTLPHTQHYLSTKNILALHADGLDAFQLSY